MSSRIILFLLSLSLLLSFSSCDQDPIVVGKITSPPKDIKVLQKTLNLPEVALDYSIQLPAHLRSNQVANTVIPNEMATLGRVLFYDKTLSRNQTVSCASCHDQKLAFSDDVAFSKGFDDKETKRNSLSLGSVVSFVDQYGGSNNRGGIGFFWDERASSASVQSKQTIQDPIEMGMPLGDLVEAIEEKDYYNILFKRAFGTSTITEERLLLSLEKFIDAIATFESKFDKAAIDAGATDNFEPDFRLFTSSENRGKSIFLQNCVTCHGPELNKPGKRTANNGLDQVYADKGVGGLSNQNGSSNGVFKVPSLRNIALTGPYMHDGRFSTLEEVVEHYSQNIKDHPNLDRALQDGGAGSIPIKMNFSTQQADDLIAFLHTFTDNEFITKEKYSDPFK